MPPTDHLRRLIVFFERIDEPRHNRGRRHKLVDILFIALVAMVGGADNAEAMQEFGEAHESWFRRLLELPHGIPSQDTYLRVFALLAPEAFEAAFRSWVEELRTTWGKGHIAIDGKTLRGSRCSGSKAIHMVSAWLKEQGLVLGQVKVDAKSNEIVAIPELLGLLDVRGATVTIDAMGCQRAIADEIIEQGGRYVLAVKDNHPTLKTNIDGFFADAARTQRPLDDPAPHVEEAHDTDAGHGRIEERTCLLSRDLSWIERPDDWRGLDGIALVRSVRTNETTGKRSEEERIYIVANSDLTASGVLGLTRDHWGIENRLHWVLDVTFGEDANRTHVGHAARNLAVLRHVALNLLRTAPGKKRSIALRRQRCGWDAAYREEVLGLPRGD